MNVKHIWSAVLAVCAFSGCASTSSQEQVLVGRYEPFGIDAGISLTLLDHGVFIADWWGQEQKHGNIIGGWTTGQWHLARQTLVLRYVTKEQESEARFEIAQKDGTVMLKLTQTGDFPFIGFFGHEYPKELSHNRTFDEALDARLEREQERPNERDQPMAPGGRG
jgi:hypothetical protein